MAKILIEASISVRWGDLDAFNHVNNSVFATYVEEARLQWLTSLEPGWYDEHAAPLLAAQTINYRKPVPWPALLRVQLSLERIGNSSLTSNFRIFDGEQLDILYAEGSNVLVWISPKTGMPIPLPACIQSLKQDEVHND